jgi:hypothetical protein
MLDDFQKCDQIKRASLGLKLPQRSLYQVNAESFLAYPYQLCAGLKANAIDSKSFKQIKENTTSSSNIEYFGSFTFEKWIDLVEKPS